MPETFSTSEMYAPPANVTEAYKNPASDPLACFKQAGTFMNQQQYLDPKYHGATNAIAQMIHTKTGDKEMTKRIITVGSIACVVTIIVFLMFAITKDVQDRKDIVESTQTKVDTAIEDNGDDFDPELSHIAKLLRNPALEFKHFDSMYGTAASARVITSANPQFEKGDVHELLSRGDSEAGRTRFDEKYGHGSARKILTGHAGRDQQKMKDVNAKIEQQELTEDALDSIDKQIDKHTRKDAKDQKEEMDQDEAMSIREDQADVEESTKGADPDDEADRTPEEEEDPENQATDPEEASEKEPDADA